MSGIPQNCFPVESTGREGWMWPENAAMPGGAVDGGIFQEILVLRTPCSHSPGHIQRMIKISARGVLARYFLTIPIQRLGNPVKHMGYVYPLTYREWHFRISYLDIVTSIAIEAAACAAGEPNSQCSISLHEDNRAVV